VPQGKSPDPEALPPVDNAGAGNLFHYNFIINIHIQHPAAGFYVFRNPGGPYDIEGIVPVHLGGEHENSRQAGDMIRMGMGYKNNGYFLPPEVELPQGNLGALPPVDEEQFPLPPQ
jgi:hypothetical protein